MIAMVRKKCFKIEYVALFIVKYIVSYIFKYIVLSFVNSIVTRLRWARDRSRVNWDEFVHYQRRANAVYAEGYASV